VTEKDPGVGGKKLSKSNDDTLERRNKSYEKVLDLQIRYIQAMQQGLFDDQANRLARWKAKSEWHEKEFGW
jgi:hypothetical protein